jgi:hypothetical protein
MHDKLTKDLKGGNVCYHLNLLSASLLPKKFKIYKFARYFVWLLVVSFSRRILLHVVS